MKLLETGELKGYPTDYLVSRIRGRRAHRIRDWENVLLSPRPLETLSGTPYGELVSKNAPEGVWMRMLEEFGWVYHQMNKGLRNTFYPFFLYTEIKTIILCLRHRLEQGNRPDLGNLLSRSLLSESVKGLLMREGDLLLLLKEFEYRFLPASEQSVALENIFLKKGLKGVEEEITDAFIKHIMSLRLHGVIKKFFVFLINVRNIMVVHKCLKWVIETDPVLIEGGTISVSRLLSIQQSGDISRAVQLVRELTGSSLQEPGLSSMENTLLLALTKQMSMAARESSDIGLILDYLWKIYIEARNLSMILYGRDIEKAVLRKELVIP